MPNDMTQMDQIVNLCKRRGFIFPSAEIYGGFGGFWDWGPLGQKLKENIKAAWWKDFVLLWDDVVGIDGAIITNPKVWEASGHVKNFRDFLIECKNCHHRFKADEILPEQINSQIENRIKLDIEALELNPHRVETLRESTLVFFEKLVPEINDLVKCPNCGKSNWSKPEDFNTMFVTNVGSVSSRVNLSFLRPETCQNIFVNFENVRESMRMKVPFGIAQVGKAFRNEITPGNFIFRSREFEQMELEYFVPPAEAPKYFDEWIQRSKKWLVDHGIKESNLKLSEHPTEKLAHYSKGTTDIMYAFPFGTGWSELWGIANRGDYDLKQHGKMARGDVDAFASMLDDDPTAKQVPYVIEPSLGVERAALAFLLDAYQIVAGGRTTTTESTKEQEVVLRLHPSIAPVKIAVLPLSKKPELQKIAHDVTQDLRRDWTTMYDETGSIGRRYRRQDEIGTPYCVTVDFDTIEGAKRPQGTVTVRDRDSMAQESIDIHDLVDYFRAKLG